MYGGDGSRPVGTPSPTPSTSIGLFSSPPPISSSSTAASWVAPAERSAVMGGGFVWSRAAASSSCGGARYRVGNMQPTKMVAGGGVSSWSSATRQETINASHSQSGCYLNGKSQSTSNSTASHVFSYKNESLTNAVSNLKRLVDDFGDSSYSDTLPMQMESVPTKSICNSDPSTVSRRKPEVVPNVPQRTLVAASSQGSYTNCFAPRHQVVYDTTNQEVSILQASQGLSLGAPVVMASTPYKRKAVSEECMNGLSCEVPRLKDNTALGSPQLSRQTPVRSSFSAFDDKLEDLIVLVHKELTKSDVSSTGRIVLPKKEAEENLPPLDESGGRMLDMEDLIFPMTWSFKYRFWSNNRSRMYVIENTGDFVKGHGLQPGDFFTIYRNKTTGLYIARGKRQIQQLSYLDVAHQDCEGQRYMDDDSVKQAARTAKGRRRKRKTRAELSIRPGHVSDTSTKTETDYFPTGSSNDSDKEHVDPSESPLSITDFDLDSFFFDDFLP